METLALKKEVVLTLFFFLKLAHVSNFLAIEWTVMHLIFAYNH